MINVHILNPSIQEYENMRNGNVGYPVFSFELSFSSIIFKT